ncbi:hypothetical protein [Rheinheimera oceanensis]|uniref:hypothetical protein n=1 Tax=Rheinheimera oceanensis TaxID=2817449 RepID=UPI001BFCDF0E|nr:hypothetical protein [Rheinheimera oceanensis]
MLKKISVAATALITVFSLLVSAPLLADDNAGKDKIDIKPYCWFICPPDNASE